MNKLLKTLLWILPVTLFTATGWAADPDVTGVIPWARYEFNGSDANTGDGGKTWDSSGGSFSYSVTGARGDAATNVSATGSRWTTKANSSLSSGLTVSVLATEGTTFAGGTDNNGHIFSMAQKNQGGSPRWWIRNSSSGTVKLQGLFTTALDVTNSVEPTGFHHYVVRISADRTKVDVFVDGIKIDTSALTVATNLDDTIYGYQLNGRWGGGAGPNATLDDVRIYDEALTDAQIAKLNVTLSKYAAIGKCRDLGIAIPENTQVTLTATPSEVTLADGALAISAPVKTANASDSDSITWKVRVDERHLDLAANKAFADGTYTLTATATEETLVLAEFSSEEAPVLAKAVTVAETTSFGATSDQEIDRTIDGKKVIVAKVTEMTADEYAASIFGVHSQAQGDKTAVQRDVYLNVTGGKYNYIVGGSENHWQGNHATPLQGNIFLEMGSGVTANNVIGVAHKGGDGANARGEYQTLTGNATTIVHGSVRGWIVGGVTTAHNCIPLITGDTLVRVTSVQTNNEGGMNDNGLAANDTDRILGGSAKIASNGSNGAKQTGNASVEIILPNGSEGNFVKEIAGGSYASGSNSYAITGNTSVLIDAPQTVTFTKPIYGGSITDGAQAPISGTASVTINGGTFTSTINAGSYGDNAKAAGVSTLTINGGDLSAATVQPGAVTSSKLVINNNVTIGTLQAFNEYEVADDAVLTVNTADLSGVTAPMTFASGTGTLTIGKNRNVTYAGFGSGVVAVTVTADEILDATLQLPVTTAVTSAPEAARFALTSETGATITPTEITLADSMLTITLPSMYLTVTESNSWSEAVGEASGAVLVVGGATAENATEITIDTAVADAITEISITGYVKMATAEGVTFPANKVKIADGAHLELTAPSQDGEWSIPTGATLTLIGGEDESATSTLSNKVTVADGGTLETKGYLTLNNNANKVNAGGILKVLTGCTVLNSGENGSGLCGRIEIAYGATLKSTRADGLHYNGSPEVHVYGTLDMGSYRWTVGTNNKFYIYGGATIKGAGDSHGALDFLAGTHTVTIPSTNNQGTEIEIPAVLRLRASDTLVKFDAQLVNSTIKLTGTVKDAGALQKVGTGNSHLELSGANKTYSGATTVSNGYLDLVGGTTLATSSIVVNSGTALQFLADANNTATTYSMPITNNARIDKFDAHTVTLEGVISGAGTLNAKAGELVLTAANTRGAGAVTIEAGATLDVSGETARLYNNSGHFNATLTVRGTLRIRDWTYGLCLGNLAHNYGRLQLDGGRIIVTTDVESARSFTVTGKGGTIEVEAGKTYTYNGTGESEAELVFNEGAVLTVEGPGTFVANGVSGSAANIGAISVASGATFKRGTNAGSVASLTFADGATLNVENGAVTVNGAVNLPDALKVVLPNGTLPTAETPVTLLATTAFAGDEGYAYVALTVNGEATEDYILRKTDTALTLVPAPVWEDVTEVTATSDVNSWTALLSKMEADSQRFEEGVTPTLTIDFGSEGGEAGTFTFNNKDAITLTSITVAGTNGGTIVMADGAEIAYGTLVLNTTVAADAAFYAENTGAIEGAGKLCLASGELTLDEANTYTGGTDIATGAKLTIINAAAIGTGTITGAGELICDGILPANMTGLTDAANWTGTLALVSTPAQADIAFNSLGNASSTVRLQDYTGSLSNKTTATCYTPNLEIKGTNTINAATEYAIPIFQGDVSGDGTIVFSANNNTNYLFSGDFSAFTGTMELTHTSPKVAIGAASNTDWPTWNPIVNNGQGNITIATAATLNGTFRAVSGVETTSSAILSGNGTIDSALTLTANATIDTSATLLTVTGAVTLPDALTVKIAEAPAVGTAVAIVKAPFAETGVVDNATVTVMVGDTPAEGTYQLIKTPTALLLDHVPAASMDVIASTEALTESFATLGDASGKGIQVDLDAAEPYAPGWVWGQSYALKSLFLKKRSNSGDAADAETTVSVVDADNPSVVIATSTSCETTDEGYRFIFTDAAILDASKTYQFRFSKVVGVRGVSVGEDQSASLYLDANLNIVIPSYVPLYTLTAERIVDDSPIVSGGDEVLAVATVPETIHLNTATFGYGMHTVLQYTGVGSPDWSQMQVEGLPEGAEVVTDGNNWGFVNHTLTVWPIGDSITAGLVKYNEGGSANWHVAGGYRLPLYQFLNQAGYGVNYIGTSLYPTSQTNDSCSNSCEDRDIDSKILKAAGLLHHEGHSGTTLDQLYTRFKKATVQTILASQGTPDVITLHLGTNDFGGGNSVDTAKTEMKQLLYVLNGAAAEGYTSEDTPLYPNAKVAVAKIIPRSDRDLASTLDAFNAWLETYAAACPEKLVLVDLGMDTSYTLLRHDGLHPSPEGYKQMARGWFAAIEKTIAPVKATETIASVDARVANRLTVTTNKAIDTSLTQTWTLDNGATVSAATIADDKRTVTLTVEGVVAGAEYTLTATNLFAADDSVTKTFTTTDIHTPTTDVTDTSATESATKLDGVTKAAEWTTFAGFTSGYTSPIGYMPESGRAWQLDVRGTNEPTVTDGVLSLNGAPLTVNFVDGHIGNTSSTYTMVMTVSNLSANDVIVTESMTSITVNGSVEGTPSGTPAPDAIQLTVKDTNTLLWGTTEIPVEVDLTDDEPDTIALSGKWVNGNNYSVAVNGGAKTNLPVSGASQIIRDAWSIGALSTADTGSSMKLHRLSFYEGAATLPPPPSIVVNVGEYASWNAALEAGVVSATMSATTLHFTADDQTFTFDNTDSVRLGVVTVTAEAGVTGGTIALGNTAEVISSSLALQTNVTAPAAFYNGCAGTVTAASAETVVAVNDATEVSLTATIQGGILKQAGTGTVTFTPGAWGSTQTPAKFEVADGTLAFGKSTTGWNNPPALVVSGGTLNLNNVYTFADNASGYLTTASPVLTMGGATATTIQGGAITPYTTGATEQMIVRYLGNDGTNAPATFAADIHSVYTNSARTRSIEVGKGAQPDGYDLEVTGTIGLSGGEYNAATLKKLGAGILKLSNTNNFPTLEVTEGTLWSNHADALGATTTVKPGATLVGSGTVATAFTLEAGATLDVTKGVVTVNGSVTLPNALNVIVDSLPTDETPVVILNTTAFAAAEGVAETVVTVNEAVSGYILYKTASAVELRVAPFEAVANPVIAANEVASWTAFMAQLTANKQTVAENAVLTIDFGNGETPGSFIFDNDEALALGEVIVIGSAGGTITKTGEAVTTASLTVNTSATLTDGAVEATDTVTIAADCALTYNQTTFTNELTTTATYTGNGKLNLIGSGSLELTKPCNVDVAVSGGASLCVNVPTTDANSAAQKAFADRVNVTTTAEALLELKQGLAFCEINAAGWVQVTGAYTLGIGGDGAGSFAADILYVIEGATLTTRAWRAYELTATSAIWVDGAIANDPQGSVRPTVKVVSGSTLSTYYAAGTLELDVTIAEGGLIEAGELTVNGSITYPDTLKVALTELPTDENPVKVLNTTAFEDATGYDWETEVTVIFTDELNHQETFVGQYLLYKTETSLELRPLMEVTEATASGEVDRWSEVLNQLSAEGKRLTTSGATLTINFGDKGEGEATPGIFTFDLANESILTLAAVQIQGTNGGTIAKEGEGVSISVGATSIAENVAVNVTAGAMELGTTTIAAGAEVTLNDTAALGTTDAASVANKVTGAGTLVLNGALPAGLANGSAGKLVAEEWTGTVKVVNVDNRNLDLGDLVRPGSSLALNNVKAYIYDCAMASLTLEGDFQQNNGTSERSKTQCVTIDTLTGSGALIGPDNAPYCTAYNVKAVENFTGAIDLSHTNAKNTIFFFGVAPERFTTSITEGNVGANDGDFTDEDFGTLYTTIALTVPAGKTWAAKGFVVEDGGSLAIAGWCDPGSRLVQNGSGAATVEDGGVLDLRGLDDLSGISVTVKSGGRVLVKSGATVPDSIVFETDATLGIVPASVDDIGSATLTVTAEGTAKSEATKKGYKTDGVTELGNWTDKEDADPDDNTLSFGYDPIFDGELCWWAYEFDKDENTTTDSTDGPDNTGRDKTSLSFDGSGSTGRILVGEEYVTNDDGTKALRLAAAPYRKVNPYPTAFTATVYGKLTSQPKTILLGFGSTFDSKDTIALVTGASANEVSLVWVKGSTSTSNTVGSFPENCVTTLATTTVPNGTTENHLFGFSYELKDTDDDGTKDTTEIVFYVDGDKYQPYKVNKVLTIGNGFQAGSLHGGWPREGVAPTASDWLNRMGNNEADKAATIEFLRVYDEVLPEATFTAMANAYPYISKVGRATRTIVAGADTTWHEAGEWSQVKVVDGVPQEPVAQDKPDFGTIAEPEIGTQVFLNVDGENTLYLNEFYSTPLQEGETSKLYYERLEINDVAGGDEDSLTMWAGRLNENEDPAYENSQSAVLTVLGYTKINTNVTFAHNVAYLSGPVAVAEGKYLHFDFSGFDVMKVPSMPVTYRLTGFLDEETRSRVTSTAPADPVNARSIDLGYKTDVNQYTFTVNRYPVTAYFTADDDPMMAAFANNPAIDFNTLSYIWQGNELGKTMNWDAEAVDPQGNPIVENTLAKFVSLDAETQQEKIVTVSLATTDAEPITLTLAEAALSKETTPAGQDTEAVVESMLGEQQLIIGNKVIVDYSGDPLALAPVLNGASAETSGVVRAQGFDTNGITWRANLSVKSGTLAGTGEVSGKLTFEEGTTLDATAATADARLTVADGDFTNLKAITVDYEVVKAAGATGFKVLALAEGHTAESLTGCTVTAVKDDATTEIWTENGDEPTLVVVREDGLYVVARPDVVVTVEAVDTVIDNNSLTLPLARRAAELGAQKLTLTAVTNVKGDALEVSIADAATLFTGVASAEDVTGDAGGATATLAYDFGITAINVVDGGEALVMQVVLSNTADLEQNTAAFAEGVSVGISCDGKAVEATEVADIEGTEGSNSGNIRYLKIAMPEAVKTHKFKARATK